MSTIAVLLLSASLILGVLVPWLGMRMLVPSLRTAERSQAMNFRGRTVFHGLGVVWLIWAGCATIAGVAAAAIGQSVMPLLTLAGPLALVAFALGVVDDSYGSGAARGFKGHIRALLKGRLTTGGMKLIGIGLGSLVVAAILLQVAPWGSSPAVQSSPVYQALVVLVAGAAIALTSNVFNLFDLRPGRALKLYALLAPLAVVSAAVGVGLGTQWLDARAGGAVLLDAAALLLFLAGPLVAVWRYDLGEEGMLGDAGANPMGTTIGVLVVSGLPLWGLVAWTLLVLGLNLVSERVSFSAVIDGNRLLSRIDAWGRLSVVDSGVAGPGSASSPPAEASGEESKEIKSGN